VSLSGKQEIGDVARFSIEPWSLGGSGIRHIQLQQCRGDQPVFDDMRIDPRIDQGAVQRKCPLVVM
jgi:hypothetical protein